MKMNHVEFPKKFNRNAPRIQEVGIEKTGSILIKLACDRVGISDLSDMDVLDIGCGVRFTQTIINRDIPIKSYTGIDIKKELMDYLMNNVRDSRFEFHYWNVYNESFNKSGNKLTKEMELPVS